MVERGPIRAEPYQHHHFAELYPKLKETYSGDVDPDMIPRDAFATTFFLGGEPIAIFGARQLHRHVFQVWAFTTEAVKKHPRSFHKMVLDLIAFWFGYAQLHRMQMSVRCGYMEGWKWAKALGFKCEGTMKNYSPGGYDCWLFARTRV
jgi:hypothetical protein